MNTNSTIQFDLTKITAREIAPYLADMMKLHMSWLPSVMPLICVVCPYGPADDPATYDLPVFGEEIGTLFQAFQQAVTDAPEAITFASVDLSKIKARDFDALVDEVNGVNVEIIAGLLAKHVSKCPEVRNVSDPEAYLDLKYYTQFRPLVNKLSKAGLEQLENFQKRFAAKSSTAGRPKTHPIISTGDIPA